MYLNTLSQCKFFDHNYKVFTSLPSALLDFRYLISVTTLPASFNISCRTP